MTGSTEARQFAASNARAIMEQLPFGATREEVEATIRDGLLIAFEMGVNRGHYEAQFPDEEPPS